MSDTLKFDREFLRTCLALAAKPEVDHFLYICDTPLSPEDLRGRKARSKLIYAVTLESLAADLAALKHRALVIPPYDYLRVDRVKVALVSALSQGAVKEGVLVLCAAGRAGRPVDTLVHVKLGCSLADLITLARTRRRARCN